MSSPELYSCCFCYVFRQQFSYFSAKHVNCSAVFNFSTKTTQTRPQGFSDAVPFSDDYPLHYTDFAYRKRLPKLVNASYEEQAVRLQPIRNGKKIVNDDNHNRPFYRYGGHMELIRLKGYYRMPRGHEHISFLLSSTFRDIFS